MRANPKASGYYIHGFGQLDEDTVRYAVVAAVSSHLSDAALVALLEDDRLAERLPELEASVQEELRGVLGIGDVTWRRLSQHLQTGSPRLLRSQTLLATSTAAAFLTNRALGVARQYPWRLCAGDIVANLQELASLQEAPIGGCHDEGNPPVAAARVLACRLAGGHPHAC